MLKTDFSWYLLINAFEASLIVFFVAFARIVVAKPNFITILISLELMLFSIGILLVSFSYYLDDLIGQVFFLFVLTVAAAESAIGLAIFVIFSQLRGSIFLDMAAVMKG